MKKVLCLLLALAMVIGCKKSTEKATSDTLNSQVDSTVVGNSQKSNIGRIQASDKYAKYSLNELLAIYASKDTSEFAGNRKDSISGEIVKRHEINDTLYAKYRDEFWQQPTTYVHEIDPDKLKEKLDKASDTDYVQFTFSNKKVATDFNYEVVKTHAFNSYVSCYPAVLLKQMLDDKDFGKIVVGKGTKELTNPPSKYKGNFVMALLKYFDNKGKVQYFDIVDDPSVSK